MSFPGMEKTVREELGEYKTGLVYLSVRLPSGNAE